MKEGNQYTEDATSWFVSGRSTNTLAYVLAEQCDDDPECLAEFLTQHYIDNVADTDASGDALVLELIDHANAGLLNSPLGMAAGGDCLEVPKDGSSPSVELQTSPDCIQGSSLDGATLRCDYSTTPSGDVGLGWVDADGPTNVVERSVGSGSWTAVYTATDPDDTEYLDTAPPSSSAYRVRSHSSSGSLISTTVCDDVPYDVKIDESDADLPRTDDGDIGGEGDGARPAVSVPTTPSVPSSDPATAPTLCGALSGPGGAGAGGALRQQISPTSVPGFTRITLPARTYLEFDVEQYKAPFTDHGNWVWYTDLHSINADGTLGNRVDRVGGSTPYYWDSRTIVNENYVLENNDTISRDFFIRTSAPTVVGIADSTQAHFSLFGVSIKRIVDDELVGRPCDDPAVNDCAAQGGDYYFAEPAVVDGDELLGCYAYETCVADLSHNIDLLVTDLNGIAEWACENDELLDFALAASLAVVVIAGVVYLAPTLAAAATTAQAWLGAGGPSLAASVRFGSVSLQLTNGQKVAFVLSAAAAGFLTLDPDRADDLVESFSDIDIDVPSITTDPQSGAIVADSAPVAEQMFERSDYEQAIRSSDPPPVRSLHRQLIVRGLQFCLANLSIDTAQEIADRFVPGHTVGSSADFDVLTGEGRRHICELATIYLPGGATRASYLPMGQATAHINEVLFDEPPIAEAFHQGDQPALPRPEWNYLNRQDGSRGRWYRDSPYDCAPSAASGNDCDEWPWQRTRQGGKPAAGDTQPHLRIIDIFENRRGGSDFGTFLRQCGVKDPEGFFVVPMPTPLMTDVWYPDDPLGPVPSTWVGPGCFE